jgi:beta-lactamase regulating signal transducer with metallopeptidase domain
MLANWMLYCAAVGALVSAGAFALETGLRALGRPTRWVWVGAMLLTLGIPAAARFVPAAPPVSAAVPAIARRAPATSELVAKRVARQPAPTRFDAARLQPALRLGWAASTGAVLLWLAAMALVLARRRRGWSAREVDGVQVLVSSDVGPAVVGLFRSRIVLPAWALAADADARRLVLEHEREHVLAGDPRLLAAAMVLAALTPWSPAAWWQLRRLRLAIEVDCDARVLRGRGDVRAYGEVLLEVGRRAVRSRLPLAAFAEPVSSLERRIRIMTAPRARRPLARAAACGALAVVLVGAACETSGPLQPAPGGNRRLHAQEGEAAGLPRAKIDLRAAVARWFPEVARDGLSEDEYLAFTVSPQGEVIGHERLRSVPRVPGQPAAAEGAIAVRGSEAVAAMRRLDLKLVRSIDRMIQPAGSVAPTPVTIVWVEMKGAGEDPGSLRVSSADVATNRRPDRMTTYNLDFRDADGLGASGVTVGGPNPDPTQLREAMHRYYTPALRSADVRGSVRLRFRVGADGSAHDVVVVESSAPALVPVARSVVASLAYPRGGAGVETTLDLSFERPGLYKRSL